MSVIGPGGNDVYAVAIIFQETKSLPSLFITTVLVEAVSKDEAVGKGWAIGHKLVGSTDRFSRIQAVDVSRSRITVPETASWEADELTNG